MIKHELGSMNELEALLSGANDRVLPDEKFYKRTYYISADKFNQLQYYRLNFNPYNEIAKGAGADQFGIWRSQIRTYLGHINNAGHAARFMIRPLTIETLKNADLIRNLENNFCYELEQGAEYGIPYDI
ncbi:hypothetical protein QWY82_18900 [Simiduia curdlanivorans]|uniref:Uncharacterized protein n=1 Tax=Simiduia curdlanivorans TaxID=1492769 RepID=A0ABV8V5R8_9GAMM|nr:hypothetical protein [Simiduia curdlanivorans]MDN3640876.1 hypothetical protein [Simiduia curdlanivorans]